MFAKVKAILVEREKGKGDLCNLRVTRKIYGTF
jgi:hypothetical protein